MKILLATDSYKHQLNGVANAVITLTDELKKRGHEVKVIALSDSSKSYKDGDDYYFSSIATPVYPDLRFSLSSNEKLLAELIDWKPDIAHIHTEFSAKRLALHVIKKANIPYVMTFHTNYEEYLSYFAVVHFPLKKAMKIWYKHQYKNSKYLIAPSAKVENMSKEYGIPCPIKVIPNGVDLKKYQKRLDQKEKLEIQKKLGLENNNKILVMVTRVSKEKRIDEIIEYMPALLKADNDIKLVITGDGPHMKHLKKLVASLKLESNVIFAGMIPPEEVYKYYQIGNIFVCASTFETQGLTYIEALAGGMPLVCKEDPCLVSIIDEGENGYTYNTQDEFVKYVTKILDNSELREHMSEYSFKKSNEFSKETLINDIIRTYESIVNDCKSTTED